ncbi:LpqB family beta-propeller domain-containing protein [Catenulispora subtropica]|uniref:GerMN domain-containing protein n=1 Tax=Catenulispora subtropica TaxID=450798 RepID=A0ABP5CAU3_9ACTN
MTTVRTGAAESTVSAGSIASPGSAASAASRVRRRRILRRTTAALAGLAVLGTAACAGPPSSGSVRTTSLSQSHNNVFIIAREPSQEMSGQELVQSFLQALTGDQKDPSFSVAQDYLTAGVRSNWIPPGGTWKTDTKIVEGQPSITFDQEAPADRGIRPITSEGAPADAPVGSVAKVSARGRQVAELDRHGFYQTMSPDDISMDFTLVKQREGWRIETLPAYRMISVESFKRVYQSYQSALPVYLPTSGVQRMDQVYLTQATGQIDYTYTALADAVLSGRGPAQSSPMQLNGQVTVSGGEAKVPLTAPAGSAPILTDVLRALAATFAAAGTTQQLIGAATSVSHVTVTYPGCGSTCSDGQPVPPAHELPAVYWVCPVPGGTDSALVSKSPGGSLGGGQFTACPTGAGAKPRSEADLTGLRLVKDAPIAVRQSGDPTQVRAPASPVTAAVVTQDTKDGKSGAVTVVGKTASDRRQWYVTSDASRITDLEWDPVDGSLWMVDNHVLYELRDPGDQGPSAASRDAIDVPAGAPLTRFKPSPDGTRAVLVAGPDSGGQGGSQGTTGQPASGAPSPSPAAMVSIIRGSGLPKVSSDPSALLSDTLASATDAAWADGRTVVVLGVSSRNSNTLRLYKVYSDGSQDSVISDPEDAQSAAKHISASTSLINGRSSLWEFSDGGDANTSYVYFKGRGGAESYQEVGSSPVIATVLPD